MDLTAIRAKVADLLSGIEDVTGYAEPMGQINPPAVLVFPGEPAIVYGAQMGNKAQLNLVLVLLLELADTELAQSRVDPYLADNGPFSIRATVNGTLGGLASIARVHTVQSYGRVPYEGSQYLGAELLMSVTAR